MLDDREWLCEQCWVVHERDFDASLNIRDEALRLGTDVPAVALSGHKFAYGAGSTGSRSFESETDLALKQERRCCKYVLLHFRKQNIYKGEHSINQPGS
jgi:hypothetical protein